MHPYYVMRVFGGVLYLSGGLIMAYNLYMTICGKLREEVPMGDSSPVSGDLKAAGPAE